MGATPLHGLEQPPPVAPDDARRRRAPKYRMKTMDADGRKGDLCDRRLDGATDEPVCRREFLKSVGCLGTAVALFGLAAGDALALPVAFSEGTQIGGERRYPIPGADSVNVDRSTQL